MLSTNKGNKANNDRDIDTALAMAIDVGKKCQLQHHRVFACMQIRTVACDPARLAALRHASLSRPAPRSVIPAPRMLLAQTARVYTHTWERDDDLYGQRMYSLRR